MVQSRYNTVGSRFWAGIIDALVFLPLSITETILRNRLDMKDFVIFELAFAVLYILYVVIGHGKYGQTLGKKVMKVKVLDINEEGVIGYGRAFLRDSVYFIFSLAGFIYYISKFDEIGAINANEYFESGEANFPILYIQSGWFLLEIITALINPKRRAIHDLIARSVVIQLEKTPAKTDTEYSL
jgi:uncharacterized RDD family membrane protein YckC